MPLFFVTSPWGAGQGDRGSGEKVLAEEDVVFDPLFFTAPSDIFTLLSIVSSPLVRPLPRNSTHAFNLE